MARLRGMAILAMTSHGQDARATLPRAREGRRETLWMLIPATAFFAVSMTSNLNIGLRHILPVYPFLAVLAAAGAGRLAQRRRAWGIIVSGLVLIHAGSSLRAFPNYLSYSNELWGGPSKTYQVLTDSNVDWGQGLPAVKRYVQTHAAAPCWLAYFGTVDPASYDLPCTLLTASSAVIWERPLGEIPPVIQGTVLVSATEMSGQAWGPGELNPYEQFRTARPVDCLAGSILVYQGSFPVPLASALSRLWKVVALASHGEFDAALTEARTAEALAPQSVDVQFVLGRVLKAAGRSEESRQAFQNALRLARTIHPESQGYWVPVIEGELSKR
jgi:tetratricopeptide (TPR) repeat protein